jgi:hypothetical protein
MTSVAVRCRPRNSGRADVAAAPAWFSMTALPPHLRQCAPSTRAAMSAGARRKRHDDLDRLVGIALGEGGRARDDGCRKRDGKQHTVHQSTFAPEASIIFAVLSISLMNVPNSSGVDPYIS